MSDLNEKNILLFAPKYFGYEEAIFSMMGKMGAQVTYFDERPKNNFFTKVCLRLNFRFFIRSLIAKYYDDIFHDIKGKQYDYILFVNPESVTIKFLNDLKLSQNNARFILYMWDSVKNKKNTTTILPYFDKAFTFDPLDAKKIDKFNFLPLFYTPTYMRNPIEIEEKYQYDICFIGTAHSDRYEIISKLKTYAKQEGLNFYVFLYINSKLLFFIRKYVTKELRNASMDEFSYHALSDVESADIISHSRVVLDIESPKQVGLTMRTFELLALKKKMMTTNVYVKEYDFYNEANITVFDRENIVLDKSWFKRKYCPIPKQIVSSYSLENWVKSVFEF